MLTSASHLEGKIKQIYIYLPDGTRADAMLVSKDEYYDLAVLKVEPTALGKMKPIEWAPKPLSQGAAIAVLGRSEPPGRITLNSGSVSAVGRYEGSCTQISGLIDYGNLGGPVIDLDGHVVGMAVHLNEKTPWRQNCGVGFMLNADMNAKVLQDLLAGKKPSRPGRPFLGLESDPTGDVKGAKIRSVTLKGPAALAGLMAGDMITVFDAKPVENWPTLLLALHSKKPGDTIKLTIKRADKDMTFDLKLGSRD